MPGKRAASRGSGSRKRPTRRSPPPARPIPGPDAFSNLREPGYLQSQAATLLLIGSHLRGDAAATRARAVAASGSLALSTTATVEALPAEDLQALGFPSMQVGAPRFRTEDLQRMVGRRFAAARAAEAGRSALRAAARSLTPTATAFYRDPNPETAAALLEVGLRHPHELVRVSAAASYFAVAADPAAAVRVLEHGLGNRDLLTRDVAAHALARLDPGNPRLAKLLEPRTRRSTRKRSRTSLIVHGTWGRASSWWQPPSGDFWKYLHDTVDGTLYGAADRFEWSGGYSDLARALAGSDLEAWVQQQRLAGLDLFTHSHGGSVAMLASQAGTAVGRLVLLSCPVHWPKYTPDFNRVSRVVSVRVHLDLVILADGGGQRFYDDRIHENVLPAWFDHFATHDPATWERYDVKSML